MKVTRETMGSIVGGVAVAAALAFFAITHEPPPVPAQDVADEAALNIPTLEEMCANLGANDPQTQMECQALEYSAGEFVVAWMGLNGFIANGIIDLGQIQLVAGLDDNAPVDPALTFDPTIDPGAGFDPGLALDPGLDPALSGDAVLGGVTDPFTGETSPVFASPAQLALFCLGSTSDWLTLQDCISMNDPSTQVGGVP